MRTLESLGRMGVVLLGLGLAASCSDPAPTPTTDAASPPPAEAGPIVDAARAPVVETLAHHASDATPGRRAFSPWVASASDPAEIAVRYEPSAYPAALTRVRVYAANETGKDVPFALRVYADAGGKPDAAKPLATASPAPVVRSAASGWIDVDVTAPVPSGAFWVSITWDPPPLAAEQGGNTFRLSEDGRMDNAPAHMVRMKDGSWRSFAGTFPVGDLFLQAVVRVD